MANRPMKKLGRRIEPLLLPPPLLLLLLLSPSSPPPALRPVASGPEVYVENLPSSMVGMGAIEGAVNEGESRVNVGDSRVYVNVESSSSPEPPLLPPPPLLDP